MVARSFSQAKPLVGLGTVSVMVSNRSLSLSVEERHLQPLEAQQMWTARKRAIQMASRMASEVISNAEADDGQTS